MRQETTILPGSAEIDVDAPNLAACEGKELRVAKTPAIRRKAEISDEGLLAPDEDSLEDGFAPCRADIARHDAIACEK